VAVFEQCKQDWFSVSCIIEDVLATVKASNPSVTRAIIRSDNAGCYHSASLLSTIHSTSIRSGIQVVRYDFSEPQAGKDLCDRKIAPCKQRLRNYVAENNNVEIADDVKAGLAAPPGISGTRVAVCKIDPSKMSPAVKNNKITGIARYYNFSFDEKGDMKVWQAYGIGEGMKLKAFENQQVSGLERAGDWSLEVDRATSKKKAKTRAKVEPTYTYACLEPACILTFYTLQEADDHMDIGQHVFVPEKENVYDTIRRQWAATTTSVQGSSQKTGNSQYQFGTAVEGATLKGWALKKQKAVVRISPAVKDYLILVFNEGTRDGHPKAKPADVAEDLKAKFPFSQWLETQTIKGFFSRLPALQKGNEITEDDDTNSEEVALAKEHLVQQFAMEAEKQISLNHPLVYDKYNLCDLFVRGKLENVLRKLKLCDLKVVCDYFEAEIGGPTTRKAPYIKTLLELVRSCQCQVTTNLKVRSEPDEKT
jgi:hypothetical protein